MSKNVSFASVDQIFREANIQMNGQVKYEEFVKIVCAPVPDYY
jgi:Ca2+-binding EF-hand superfamily protein